MLPKQSGILKHLQQQLASSSIGMAVLWSAPAMTPAAVEIPDTAVQIQVDVPGLIELAKSNADPIRQALREIAPYIKISQFPQAKWEFLRDAIAGDALISINGRETADVSVASDAGILDVELHAFATDFSITISNDYLPKLPLAEKRTIRNGVRAEPARVIPRTTSEDTTTTVAPSATQGFWDRTDFDVWDQGWSNRRVIGTTSLLVGAAYAGSFAYYTAEQEREEAEAEQKKQSAIAKRKAIATSKPVVAPSKPTASEKKPPASAASKKPVKKPVKAERAEDDSPPDRSLPASPDESKTVVPQDSWGRIYQNQQEHYR